MDLIDDHSRVDEGPPQGRRPALNYQTPTADQPPRTRVRIETFVGGIRYIDPPPTWRDLRAGILHGIFGIPFTIAVCAMMIHGLKLQDGARKLAITAMTAMAVWLLYRAWRDLRRQRLAATVIEVSANRLRLSHPVAGEHDWAASEISGLCAVRSGSLVPTLKSHRGHIRIRAWGRAYSLLQDRPYGEAKWFASELRRALGIDPLASPHLATLAGFIEPRATPADLPAEVDSLALGGDGIPPWSGRPQLGDHPLAIPRGEAGRRRLRKVAHRYGDAYDQLGCLGGLVLFGGGIVGIPLVVLPTMECIVISLQFGVHAYFGEHIRFVPHGREFQLTNGQMLNDYLKMLIIALWFILAPVWGFLCVNLVLGTKLLAHRLCRR